MSFQKVHTCECPICCQEADHADKVIHRQFNVVLSRLNEQQRRWMVALESKKIGHGGDRFMAKVSGISVETIRKGRKELEKELKDRPVDRVRLPGGGRPRAEKKIPACATG